MSKDFEVVTKKDADGNVIEATIVMKGDKHDEKDKKEDKKASK